MNQPQLGIISIGKTSQITKAWEKLSEKKSFVLTKVESREVRPKIDNPQNLSPHYISLSFGITDSRKNENDIFAANVEKTLEWIHKLHETYPEAHFLTWGTVFELSPKLCEKNTYLRSKLKLSLELEKLSLTEKFKNKLHHIRLHTLMSESPPSHMFLGQMKKSIQNNTDFEMTSGEQLREYQDVEDVLEEIYQNIKSQKLKTFQTLSHGVVLSLRELATHCFESVSKSHLLKIGHINRNHPEQETPIQIPENENVIFKTQKHPLERLVEILKK